jgi:acylphosphatase
MFTLARAYVNIPPNPMKARAHILVSGRVQGVFFRDHTRRWAASLGLTGWIRNLGDGRVEVLAEGERERIDDLIARLREGPPLAAVEDLDIDWAAFRNEFSEFRITWG